MQITNMSPALLMFSSYLLEQLRKNVTLTWGAILAVFFLNPLTVIPQQLSLKPFIFQISAQIWREIQGKMWDETLIIDLSCLDHLVTVWDEFPVLCILHVTCWPAGNSLHVKDGRFRLRNRSRSLSRNRNHFFSRLESEPESESEQP